MRTATRKTPSIDSQPDEHIVLKDEHQSATIELSAKEMEARRLLFRDMAAECKTRRFAVNVRDKDGKDVIVPGELTEAARQEAVDAVLQCIARRGWRIHRLHIFCGRCAAILEEARLAILDRLPSRMDRLNEQIARQKEEAIEHIARLGEN